MLASVLAAILGRPRILCIADAVPASSFDAVDHDDGGRSKPSSLAELEALTAVVVRRFTDRAELRSLDHPSSGLPGLCSMNSSTISANHW